MGLKFNFRAIPLHWRLLIGAQLGLGAIMVYRQRALKAKQQQE